MSAQIQPMNETASHYVAEFERVGADFPGEATGWVQELRQQGLARFNRLGLPTTRNEHWKYTDVRPIAKRDFTTVTDAAPLDERVLAQGVIPGLDTYQVVFVDGIFSVEASQLGGLPAGVRVENLADVLNNDPERLKPYLERQADYASHGFTALNVAFLGQGAIIQLERDTDVDRPIHLVFVSTQRDEPVVAHPRVIIAAGEHSRATVLESFIGAEGAANLLNTVTDTWLAPGAEVTHYKLQRESDKGYHIGTTNAYQDRDSRFHSHAVQLGGRLVRSDINVRQEAEGAEANLNGLFLLQGRQHVDVHTRIDHAKPHTTSREYYKGVFDGHSRGVFSGKVVIHEHAQKADADQTSKSLLLSPNAEVDPKPELEIYADDVKAGHGATVGQLDEEALFYLRTRGVSEAEARSLLIYAFAFDVINHMELTPVRAQLEELVTGRLPETEAVFKEEV